MDHGGGDQIIDSHRNGSDLTIIRLICLFFSQWVFYIMSGGELSDFLYEKFPVASFNFFQGQL